MILEKDSDTEELFYLKTKPDLWKLQSDQISSKVEREDHSKRPAREAESIKDISRIYVTLHWKRKTTLYIQEEPLYTRQNLCWIFRVSETLANIYITKTNLKHQILTIILAKWLTKTFGSHTQENTVKVAVNVEFVHHTQV